MAIEINLRKANTRPAPVAEAVLPSADMVLPRTARINLSLRRRRLRRIQQALGTAAWVAGTALLLFLAAAGVLSLH